MWQRIKDFSWDWRGVFITTPAIATFIGLLRLSSSLQFLELAAFDQFMRWRPPLPLSDDITIIGVGATGHSVVSDGEYAQLLEALQSMEPREIGLDIYRDIPVEPGNAELEAVFRKYDNILGIEKIVGDSSIEKVPPPPVLKEKDQVGFNDVIPDPDSRIRRAILSLNDENNETLYSWPLILAYNYLGGEGIQGGAAPGTDNWFQFGDAVLEPLEANSGGYSGRLGKIDAQGYQVFINYRGRAGSFDQVPMEAVLAGDVPRELIRDRLVLIGDISEVNKDLFAVPFTLAADQRMPGVEVHANIASQIIDSARGDRPLIQVWSEWQEILWIVFWTGVGASLAWGLRNTGHGKAWSWERFIGLGGAVCLLWGSSFGALVYSWWIPVVPPFLGLFLRRSPSPDTLPVPPDKFVIPSDVTSAMKLSQLSLKAQRD